MSSSPAVRKKQALRKLEGELKSYQPSLYKNGMFLPNMGELFRILYENTKPIHEILSETVCSEDIRTSGKYEMQLFITGLSQQAQETLENLSYENRIRAIEESKYSMQRELDSQRHQMEGLSKDLNTPEFIKIEEVIAELHQLNDICKFNYMNVVHAFDSNYTGLDPNYRPDFKSVAIRDMGSHLQDLYYLSAKIKLSLAVARAVEALEQLKTGKKESALGNGEIVRSIGKINTVLVKILNPDILKKMIAFSKGDPEFTPQVATYTVNARRKFAEYLHGRFESEEKRIKIEVKDRKISADLKELFANRQLEKVEGYNAEMDEKIRKNSGSSFSWIVPVQIVKTFLLDCYPESVRGLINDIVIEGFFNNNNYKSEFSSTVFAADECMTDIEKFEKSFDRNGRNDTAVLEGYIKDGHKNVDFIKRLEASVESINSQAHELVKKEAGVIYQLYNEVKEILNDSKKAKPDTITNIKTLLTATRHAEVANLLEQNFGKWSKFLEIMKNYVILGAIENKS